MMSDPTKGEGQEIGRTRQTDETERAIKGSTEASSGKQGGAPGNRRPQSGGSQRGDTRAPKAERDAEADPPPSSGSTGSQSGGSSQSGSGTRGGEGSRGGPSA
jgi:hypothetical protein